jgi:serine/threonine-protein kinase
MLLHRHVAVKVLRQQYVHDEEFIRRFRREAQSAASLSHPNVVSIYDVGQEEDTHYIVMEYIEGTTLNDLIKERAPLQVEEAVHIASQICDALDHAHQNQIIHRDIKPHNILIGKNGRVKVTDFGIARAITSSTITQTGSVVGSVHYFSPEHAKGTATGEQSDLYSLGIVLYQMLTARLPFLGESPISVALKHLQEDVEEPRKANPLIPQSVENIILKAMRKSPAERYQTASQMLADLDSCMRPERRNEPKIAFHDDYGLDEERTLVMPAIRPDQYSSDASGNNDPDDPSDEEELDGRKRNRWIKPVVLLLIFLGIVAGGYYAFGYINKSMAPIPDVLVPSVVGQPVEEAQKLLKDANLTPEVELEFNEKVAKDTVIRQSQANLRVKVNSKIVLTVSKGIEKQKMPPLVGTKLAEAKLALSSLGITEITLDPKFLDDPPDTIVQQSPPQGEEIDPATTTVKLTVSKGRETFKMPNLVGLTEQEARNKITVQKLVLPANGVTYEASYKQPKGKVIKQFPYEFNEDASPGAEIKLIVSSGLPEDAGPMSVNVTVQPAANGKASEVKLYLTDASYDNYEYRSESITKPTNFEVKLVVSKDKKAVIQIKRDGALLDAVTVTYQDYMAQKSGKTITPGPQQPPAGTTTPGGTTPGTTTPGGATPGTTTPGGTTPGTTTPGGQAKQSAETSGSPATPAMTPPAAPPAGTTSTPGGRN